MVLIDFNTNSKTYSLELQNLAGFTAVIMAKQLSLASWVSKRKKRRVGDPEESLAVRYSNWASEASPTLGCSIEISGDYNVGMSEYVCRMSN